MTRRVLVANRGEIACRVFRTCERLGIATAAVAAPADVGALHTRTAQTTVEVASYLDPAEIVRACREADADAVHPGYGFLSESPDLAEAVLGAGLTWIGPPPEALRLGGDKLAAKRIAVDAGVPVLAQGDPADVGYPLLVKAAAGGGGRGMRVVRSEEELEEALAAAAREAEAAFGDGTVFCERYLEHARHIEVQVLADTHGTVVSLGERECSIQRRHQKVLEESPSTALDETHRERLSAAAVAFASAIGYVSAGTAEFLVDGDEIAFLELNARIQVEHPVTEAVTGLDLIEQQLRIAAGEPLVTRWHKGAPGGHAIEVRLYAEDPRTFLPQAGIVERLRLPDGIRVDAGVAEGDEVGLAYDPMIAKLIAHAETRDEAIAALATALAATDVGGITTNLPFLRWLVAHPAFRSGDTTTSFLVEHPPLSTQPLRDAAGAWQTSWRLNLPAPPRRTAPVIEDAAVAAGEAGDLAVTAPMPGTVIAVAVNEGDEVAARQPLLTLEAMKMEVPVHAPLAGRVRKVLVEAGDRVAGGAVLVELG